MTQLRYIVTLSGSLNLGDTAAEVVILVICTICPRTIIGQPEKKKLIRSSAHNAYAAPSDEAE